AYRYPERESTYERFLVHRTVFPRDFLADFGFQVVRTQGRVELLRLELGGLVPVLEGRRAHVLRGIKEAFAPAPVPQRPRHPAGARPGFRVRPSGTNRAPVSPLSRIRPTLALVAAALAAAIVGGAVPTSATAVAPGFTDTLVASIGRPTAL